MDVRSGPFPWPSLGLAITGTLLLAFGGGSLWVALAILLLWCGSIWLAIAEPPQNAPARLSEPLSLVAMEELFEFSGTPVLIIDKARISVANRAARKKLGAHIVGQDWRIALRHPEAIALLESKRKSYTRVRGLVRRRDVWRINRKTLRNGLIIVELINETAEEDIGRAHTDFVANASHELRTPLSSIIGYVETLQDDDGADRALTDKFLSTIHSEAKRLQSLVSDLMSLSRVEAEKHETPRSEIAFDTLVMRAANEVAGLERKDRLDFIIGSKPVVRGDERQLEQLVRNLVDNALKYGEPESPVTIALDHGEGSEARLRVSDRGDGIAADHLPHLTRRFYRTDPSRSRASGGTGLGLAIVKHIVERHLGRLDITSTLGQGTTVTVRLPSVDNEME